MKLTIGQELIVNAVEYASRANAILGIRDSGKTYTATLIAEQLFECRIPFFAFDPIGRWRFLRSPAKDGGKGFPVVVAGGVAPDLPLTPENAPKLVRAAMQGGLSMVIDLYSIGLSKKDWRAIVRRSIETILYEGDGYGQRHVFLEEAAEFIPQHVRDGQTYAAVEKLARMGGNVGVGITLINQRAEEVNKAVLELCDNLLLHRQRGKNSLLSLRKWLEAGNVFPPKEITDSLADLPTGQCWAWFKDVGRPRLVHIASKTSFDPNRREMARATGPTPKAVDVSTFVAQMKAALTEKAVSKEEKVTQAEADALRADNADLREKVKQLEARLSELAEHNVALMNQVAPVRKILRGQTAAVDEADEIPGVKSRNGQIAPGALPTDTVDIDMIYAEVKRRALAEAPVILQLLTARPEINVTVERKTVTIDGASLKGRVARLIANGFFDAGTTDGAARAELKRVGGSDTNNGARWKVLQDLVRDGFFTKEGDLYRAVPGMKVNVVET